MRVSPPKVFGEATRAAKPPGGAAGANDAHRQSRFVLGEEFDLVVDGLNLEAAVAKDAAGSKYRNQRVASLMATWSRSWLARLDALHAAEWGNYPAALALLRDSLAHLATARALTGPLAEEWQAWLDNDAIRNDATHHAMAFRFQAPPANPGFEAGSPLAEVARAVEVLAGPSFAATLALAGADSSPDRVMVTFGDRDFHFGFAELVSGWLLATSADQAAWLGANAGLLPVLRPEELETFARQGTRLIERRDRCRPELLEGDDGVLLLHNWRRTPSAAPKRLLL